MSDFKRCRDLGFDIIGDMVSAEQLEDYLSNFKDTVPVNDTSPESTPIYSWGSRDKWYTDKNKGLQYVSAEEMVVGDLIVTKKPDDSTLIYVEKTSDGGVWRHHSKDSLDLLDEVHNIRPLAVKLPLIKSKSVVGEYLAATYSGDDIRYALLAKNPFAAQEPDVTPKPAEEDPFF